MGGWADLQLSWQLVIVLGILTLITLTLGLIRLIVRKRRIARNNKHQELEDGGTDNAVQLIDREPMEGELFGVRAIEKGFYGGVAQSRPSTAATLDKLHGVVTNMSGTTLNSAITSTPSPKRLTLGFGSFPVSNFDEMEPSSQNNESPLPKASGEASTNSFKEFQPGPKSTLLPDSKREPVGEGNHITAHLRSPTGNILTYDEPLSPSPVSSPGISPVLNDFPLSPAPASRSVAVGSSGEDNYSQRPPMRGREDAPERATLSVLPSITIPNTEPRLDSYQPRRGNADGTTTGDNDSPTKDSPSSDCSGEEDPIPNKLSSPSRRFQTSELNPPSFLIKPQSTDSATLPSFNFNFPPPTHQPKTHTRNQSSGSLKRTYDSIKIKHFKNSSKDSIPKAKTSNHELEKQRDQIHYDPKNHRRNRSGSIQGKSVNFDRPRESPFSNNQALNEIIATTRSRSSSTTSIRQQILHTRNRSNSQPITQNQRISAALPSPASISSIPTISVGRYRSDSESSMGSISDLYNTYIKKSFMKPVKTSAKLVEGEESGLFDFSSRTEFEQMEYERAEREKNGLLSAAAAVGGVRKARKSPPASLDLEGGNGERVPRAVESPVSGWRI